MRGGARHPAAVFAAAELGGNPVIPLVPMLKELAGPAAAELVHRGATSQDILDTAAMLVVRRCSDLVRDRLVAVRGVAADLARAHGATPMIGRTLLQHAVPTTFGAVVDRWLAGLDAARTEIGRVDIELPLQLGGPVGDRASFGSEFGAVVALVAAWLTLVAPATSWHTQRAPTAAIAGAWGLAASAIGAIALDIVLLAAERRGRGGRACRGRRRIVVDGAQAQPGRRGQRPGRGHADPRTGGHAARRRRQPRARAGRGRVARRVAGAERAAPRHGGRSRLAGDQPRAPDRRRAADGGQSGEESGGRDDERDRSAHRGDGIGRRPGRRLARVAREHDGDVGPADRRARRPLPVPARRPPGSRQEPDRARSRTRSPGSPTGSSPPSTGSTSNGRTSSGSRSGR